MLKRLYADNYRCFVNFEFRPEQMNLLLGDNGSGKSTVFGVLIALQDFVARRMPTREAFPTVNLTAWESVRNVQTFELDIESHAGVYRYSLEIDHDRSRGEARIKTERLLCNEMPLYRCVGSAVEIFSDEGALENSFSATSEESFLSIFEPRASNRKIGWFKDYMEGLIVLRLDVRAIGSESPREEDRLSRDGSNFASWYRNVLQARADAVPDLTTALRRILDGFKGLKMTGPAGRKRDLYAEFWPDATQAAKTYELPFDELSDGQVVLIVLYALLYTALREEHLICFDEPDNYVSLREIQPWLVALSETIRKAGGQALVISHHPEVIDYLAADHAWEFLRPGSGPARVRPLEVDREAGLTASRWIIERDE